MGQRERGERPTHVGSLEQPPEEVIDRLPQPLASQMAAIASTVAPIQAGITGPFPVAKRQFYYDFGRSFHHSVQDLDYLKD